MKKLGESKEKWHKAGYEDGYRKGVEDAAKIIEPMAVHNETAYTGNKDLARGYRHAISVINALLEKSR